MEKWEELFERWKAGDLPIERSLVRTGFCSGYNAGEAAATARLAPVIERAIRDLEAMGLDADYLMEALRDAEVK